jgi:hypothetical protein
MHNACANDGITIFKAEGGNLITDYRRSKLFELLNQKIVFEVIYNGTGMVLREEFGETINPRIYAVLHSHFHCSKFVRGGIDSTEISHRIFNNSLV